MNTAGNKIPYSLLALLFLIRFSCPLSNFIVLNNGGLLGSFGSFLIDSNIFADSFIRLNHNIGLNSLLNLIEFDNRWLNGTVGSTGFSWFLFFINYHRLTPGKLLNIILFNSLSLSFITEESFFSVGINWRCGILATLPVLTDGSSELCTAAKQNPRWLYVPPKADGSVKTFTRPLARL